MKKLITLTLALIITLSLASCQSTNIEQEPNSTGSELSRKDSKDGQVAPREPATNMDNSTNSTTPQGITVNTIRFEHLTDQDVSSMIKEDIEKNRQNRGYQYYLANDGTFTLVVYAGENTEGYSLEVVSVEDNEGKAVVLVEETKPKEVVKQQKNYPYDVVSFTGTTDNFHIANTKGDRFKPID